MNVDKAGIYVGRSPFFERGRVYSIEILGCSEWRFYPSFHFTLGVIYLIGYEYYESENDRRNIVDAGRCDSDNVYCCIRIFRLEIVVERFSFGGESVWSLGWIVVVVRV